MTGLQVFCFGRSGYGLIWFCRSPFLAMIQDGAVPLLTLSAGQSAQSHRVIARRRSNVRRADGGPGKRGGVDFALLLINSASERSTATCCSANAPAALRLVNMATCRELLGSQHLPAITNSSLHEPSVGTTHLEISPACPASARAHDRFPTSASRHWEAYNVSIAILLPGFAWSGIADWISCERGRCNESVFAESGRTFGGTT